MQWFVLNLLVIVESLFFLPDIDECEDGTAMCHSNATCSNTEGSYNCTCVNGYSGDGFNCTSKMLLQILTKLTMNIRDKFM